MLNLVSEYWVSFKETIFLLTGFRFSEQRAFRHVVTGGLRCCISAHHICLYSPPWKDEKVTMMQKVYVYAPDSDWESLMSVHGGGWGGGWVSQRRGVRSQVSKRVLIPATIDFKPPLWYHSTTAALYCTKPLKTRWELQFQMSGGLFDTFTYETVLNWLFFQMKHGCRDVTLHIRGEWRRRKQHRFKRKLTCKLKRYRIQF